MKQLPVAAWRRRSLAHLLAVQALQARQAADDEGSIAGPGGAGVAQQVELAQGWQVAQRSAQAQQAGGRHKVGGEVQHPQRLAALQVGQAGDVVEGQVEVLQLLGWGGRLEEQAG